MLEGKTEYFKLLSVAVFCGVTVFSFSNNDVSVMKITITLMLSGGLKKVGGCLMCDIITGQKESLEEEKAPINRSTAVRHSPSRSNNF